jgi:dipeptidyl aminopeptidase/acylaminoacyl peptidase
VGGEGGIDILVEGNDFYAAPRLSPDGRTLAWLTWNHPDMPWDAAELWIGEVQQDGSVAHARHVAGGPRESVAQPRWSPRGVLHFVSDRDSGWWQLFRYSGHGIQALTDECAEFTMPQWVFGMSTYGFGPDGRILCTYCQEGLWHLATWERGVGLERMHSDYTNITYLRVDGDAAAFVGGAADRPSAVVRMDLAAGHTRELRRACDLEFGPAYLSTPEPVEFLTEGGRTAHGLFYAPRNPDYVGPEDERPPLVVMVHGGPTAATSSRLRLGIQYYTSRGIAVLDVNYAGSTGYGRPYRERLYGEWGVADVDDCCAGARHLAEHNRVDGRRMAVTGGSAGGYTVLSALTFRDVFAAGASHFGVSDCELLANETHKFESRYLDKLIGPYPEARDLYVQRSPIHHLSGLDCPVIFFQGLEDPIVPPNQARTMADALRERGVPVALMEFEGEQHGFRKDENIRRAIEAELYFFSRIFGFAPADEIEPVDIDNLED